MEDLARLVAFLLFFPVFASPIVFLITWKIDRRSLMFFTIPLSVISGVLGVFLLLSEIGTVARGMGLWGILFALGTWRILWNRNAKGGINNKPIDGRIDKEGEVK